jgi:nitrate/nitrite transport system ATP-binding protein
MSDLSDVPILALHDVSKSFGTTRVLSGVSLQISPGEVVAIVGFSGAGKSTLIALLAGLERPDQGRVTFRGRELRAPGPERGVVFQNYSLLPWLTASENVSLAVEQVFAHRPKAEQRAQVERFIQMVGLEHASARKPGQLSGGMRQRVALARALAADPEVLLMDEPLSALDALTRGTLQDSLERIARESGKTIVLVTNDVDEAILLADRILPLSAGPAATLGPEFRVNIPRQRERRALSSVPEFRHLRSSIVDYLLGSKRERRASDAATQPS